jgi:uncharacterized protein YqhQ
MGDKSKVCPTSIGGQAVIEGVMMKGPENTAIAIRKMGGEIVTRREKTKSIDKRYPLFKLPIFRGMFMLIDTMVLGVRSLTYSAEQAEFDEGDAEPSRFDRFLEKIFGGEKKAEQAAIYFSVFLSLVLTVLLFIILPTFLIRFIKTNVSATVVMNLMEGLLRIGIFLVYLLAVSRMKDIQRVFEYHGAEHKTIHCYEHRQELTPENAASYSRLHPRCGTSFLLIVMVVSIIVFSFMGWPNMLVRIISRILLLPLVAGISYEIIKWAGRSESALSRVVRTPGLFLQRLTTREPDNSQLEVAIAALKAVAPEDQGVDAW